MNKKRIAFAFVVLVLLAGVYFVYGKNSFKVEPEQKVKVKTKTATETVLGYVKDLTVSCYTLVETPSDGKFANGEWARPGKVVASNNLDFGTEVKIEGFDGKYIVKDRMKAGWRHADLDVYFGDTLEDYKECKEWGKKELEVLILQDRDTTLAE